METNEEKLKDHDITPVNHTRRKTISTVENSEKTLFQSVNQSMHVGRVCCVFGSHIDLSHLQNFHSVEGADFLIKLKRPFRVSE